MRSDHPQDPSTLQALFQLLKHIRIRPVHLAGPVLLSIVAAAFEGASIGLLIPLLNGFLSRDFSFVKSAPLIGNLLNTLPVGATATDRSLFIFLIVVFIASVVLKNILKYLSSVSMSYLAERSMHHLRKNIFSRYLQFGKLYFDRSSVGHHATILSELVGQAMQAIITLPKYMNALFSFIVYLIVMFSISWKLTLFALPVFAVLHMFVTIFVRRIRSLSSRIAAQGTALGRMSVEVLSLIPLVKAYGTQRLEQDRYTTISDRKARLDFRSLALEHAMLPSQELFTMIAASALFTSMLYLMVNEATVAAPALMVYFYIVVNSSSKFGMLTGFRGTLARSSGPVREILRIFDDERKYFVPDGTQLFCGLQCGIEFRDVSFSYTAGRTILDGVSLSVQKGNITAIVGPTGAGKSTIINLLMRYYDCPPGTIFVDGKDLRGFTIASWLHSVALVSQDTMLLHASLRDNITYGLMDVSDEAVDTVVRRAHLNALVSHLPDGLSTLVGDRGVKLSGGEKQRVSIARALLKNSEILILDEATSSLDSRTEILIQEAIDAAVSGRTSIVIAHRLSTIRHADKIIVIDDGRVVEEGRLEELLAHKGKFYELWEQQKFH